MALGSVKLPRESEDISGTSWTVMISFGAFQGGNNYLGCCKSEVQIGSQSLILHRNLAGNIHDGHNVDVHGYLCCTAHGSDPFDFYGPEHF